MTAGQAALALAIAGSGCYRYAFEQQPAAPGRSVVTHVERVPTYLNGLVGRGTLRTAPYCDRPLRTEVRVSAVDVLLSLATLLVYTPHTLSVTCPAPAPEGQERAPTGKW